MSERAHKPPEPTPNQGRPGTLAALPLVNECWMLRFSWDKSGQSSHPVVRLVESLIQRPSMPTPANPSGSELEDGISLSALCLAAVMARRRIAGREGAEQFFEVARSQLRECWLSTLLTTCEKEDTPWGQAIFLGTSADVGWKANMPFKFSRLKPEHTPNEKEFLKKTLCCEYIARGGDAADKQLRIFVGGEGTGSEIEEITSDVELLNLAIALEEQHRTKWRNQIVERPHALELDAAALERFIQSAPQDRKWFQSFRDWRTKVPDPAPPAKNRAERKSAREKSRSKSLRHPSSADAGFWKPVAAIPSLCPQPAVAQAHSELCHWLRQHGQWNDVRPSRRALGDLAAIADDLNLRLPMLYDLALELRQPGKLPPLHHGFRASPLREPDDTVALQVPLLAPDGELKAGRPLSFRAFRGWLKIELVRVPRWDVDHRDGEPMWTGGNLYGAPVFELLDRDESFNNALKAAVDFVATRLNGGQSVTGAGNGRGSTLSSISARRTPLPAAKNDQIKSAVPELRLPGFPDYDFRWSLARTDGQSLPPIIAGSHLGAAFALALGKAAGLTGYDTLDFEGVAVAAGISADGKLISPPHLPLLTEACRQPSVPATVALVLAGEGHSSSSHSGDATCRHCSFGSITDAAAFFVRRGHTADRWPMLARGLPPEDIPADFVPRPGDQRALDDFLRDYDTGFLEIRKEVGEGKTTSLHHAVREAARRLESPVAHFTNIAGTDTADDIARSFADRLRRKYGLPPPDLGRARDPQTDLRLLLGETSQCLRAHPGACETLYLDAADQVTGGGLVLPGVFQEQLPERIRVVITTRPNVKHWRGGTGVTHVRHPETGQEAADLTQRREDIAQYLGRFATRLPGLTPDFIHQVCFGDASHAPVFKTVSILIRRAMKNPQKPLAPVAQWRLPPRPFLLLDLRQNLRRLESKHGVTETQFWAALGALALIREPAGLTREQFQALGLWQDGVTNLCLEYAADFIKPRRANDPFQLHHADNFRLLLGELSDNELKELDPDGLGVGLAGRPSAEVGQLRRMLVKGFLGAWRHAPNPAHALSLHHLPRLLREAGRWNGLAALLCNFDFPLARIEAGLAADLMTDYAESCRLHPEVRQAEDERRRVIDDWVRQLQECAAGRLPRAKLRPPAVVPISPALLSKAPPVASPCTQFERLLAWRDFFISTHRLLTTVVGRDDMPHVAELAVSLALNSAANGPVAEAATAGLSLS